MNGVTAVFLQALVDVGKIIRQFCLSYLDKDDLVLL